MSNKRGPMRNQSHSGTLIVQGNQERCMDMPADQSGRGRLADTPLEIPPKGWRDILWRVYQRVVEDNIGLIAAGVAFYGLMGLFPGIAALMAIGGLLLDPSMVASEIQKLVVILPTDAAQIIIDQAMAVAGSHEGGLGVAVAIGLLTALYSSSRGVASLVQGMNVAYEEREKRGFFKVFAMTIVLTLFLISVLILTVATIIALPVVIGYLPLGTLAEDIVLLLRWPIITAVVVFALAVLYRWGPSRTTPRWRWVTPGAVLACLFWVLGTYGFGFYVGNFGSYNETFGALGGVIVLLLWMWLSAFIVLLGAEFDAEMEAQTRKDSTVGMPRPMGHRGAIKADQLGEKP